MTKMGLVTPSLNNTALLNTLGTHTSSNTSLILPTQPRGSEVVSNMTRPVIRGSEAAVEPQQGFSIKFLYCPLFEQSVYL